MARYIRDGGRWVPADEWRGGSPASGVAIHSDFAEPLHCPADGRMHGSKATYDRAVRAAGCEVVGRAEMARVREQPQRRPDLPRPAETIRRLLNN